MEKVVYKKEKKKRGSFMLSAKLTGSDQHTALWQDQWVRSILADKKVFSLKDECKHHINAQACCYILHFCFLGYRL